jgi:hypothetical protein
LLPPQPGKSTNTHKYNIPKVLFIQYFLPASPPCLAWRGRKKYMGREKEKEKEKDFNLIGENKIKNLGPPYFRGVTPLDPGMPGMF